MAKKKTVFECSACGNKQAKWMGKCPECGVWDSFVELSEEQIKFIETSSKIITIPNKAQEICDIKIEDVKRVSTEDKELDLVLGGGIVEGSLVLIGGSPGIGKSTLLLKIASNLAKKSLAEISLENIKNELLQNEYKFLVIDSIQTLYSDTITSAPGSVSQVREITFELMRIAKEKGISVFIIGHITKEGSIAGPRVLEHMVDVVLYFEGDASKELRVLRGFKNRFGSTSEVGIFEMSDKGLISAKDVASKFFTRGSAISGSAITVIMEGSRPLIVEIQALVCESSYPKRSSTGYDKNRLDMIIALLDRKMEILLGHYDVFINVIGGVKISETAADLAVVAAIVSSFKNRPISKESIFLGEVSLNGEIRDISNLDLRVKEAKMQNFRNVIAPSLPIEEKGIKIFKTKEIRQILDMM